MSLVMLDWMGPEVAWIRLNDPQRLNAMGEEMAADFGVLMGHLKTRSLRAVVLSGEGKAFSAGGDLAMLEAKQTRTWEQNSADMLAFYRTFLALLDLQVPLLAAAHGWAVGAGCCLLAACDIRLADPGARFRVPFLGMGLFPGMGSTHWFSQRMGPWASEFLLTGSTLNAQQAAARGLLTGVSEPGQVLDLARAQVERVLQNGPEVTRDLIGVMRQDLTPILTREADLQARSYNRAEFSERLKKC
jgi:enoyl-CoA hydratase